MKIVKAILEFCSILDSDGNISLSSIIILILMIKVINSKTLDWQSTSALLIALTKQGHEDVVGLAKETNLITINQGVMPK